MKKKKAKYIYLYYRNGFYKFKTGFGESDPKIRSDGCVTVEKYKRYVFKTWRLDKGYANEARVFLAFTLRDDLRCAERLLRRGYDLLVPEEISDNLEYLQKECCRIEVKALAAANDCHA